MGEALDRFVCLCVGGGAGVGGRGRVDSKLVISSAVAITANNEVVVSRASGFDALVFVMKEIILCLKSDIDDHYPTLFFV